MSGLRSRALACGALTACIAGPAMAAPAPPAAFPTVAAAYQPSELSTTRWSDPWSEIGLRAGAVTVRVTLSLSGDGVYCASCADDTQAFLARRVGGRVFVALVRRARCPALPEGISARRFLTRTPHAGAASRSIDLPYGDWILSAAVPRRMFPPGRWRLCTWVRMGPDIPVTTPSPPGQEPRVVATDTLMGPYQEDLAPPDGLVITRRRR